MEQNTSIISCPADARAACGPDASWARQQASQALDRLIAAVGTGQSHQLRAYLAMLGRFHRYSCANVFLIGLQCPGATHVAGYRTWQGLGRQVRRGEKAIRILAPVLRRASRDSQEEEEAVVAFRTASVFDVSQTSGEPLPEFARVGGTPGKYAGRLQRFIRSKGIALRYSNALGPAEGVSSGGQIVVRSDLDSAAEFSVLVHELAHEMLHRRVEGTSRTVRETEAEAVAFVVCEAIGLKAAAAASDYIQLYQGDKATLVESLGRIQQAAAEIIRNIRPEEGPRPPNSERQARSVRASSRAQEEALHNR
jgi:antirestriction protein ArdC